MMVRSSLEGVLARGRQLYRAHTLSRLNAFSQLEIPEDNTENCLPAPAPDLCAYGVRGSLQKLPGLEERRIDGFWSVWNGLSNSVLPLLSSRVSFSPLCRPLAFHLSAPITSHANSIPPASSSAEEISTGLPKSAQEENTAHIGYRPLGGLASLAVPLKIVKQPVFAVVQVGSHQFKVTPGDSIYVEKLLHADVNEKLALDKVLLLGSRHQTIIGRPVVPGAHVVALLEEHMLDGKVIVFKKKRRKNYRRTRGHRQELTRLRILEVVGIEAEPAVDGSGEEKSEEGAQVLEAASA